MDCLVKIMPIYQDSKLPTKAHDGDAGFDVYNIDKPLILGFGERYRIPLGFAIEIPPGWVALIQEKSGLATNSGIMTIGNVIDSGYRGECHATLVCLSQKPVTIERGQKVAQMLILPCYTGKTYEVRSLLEDTERGSKGFGSSGL